MGGFKRISDEVSPAPPKPTSEAFAEVVHAIHAESDADGFLGVLANVLYKHGFTPEANKVIRYPSIFCPCVTHVTRKPVISIW